MKPVRIKKGSGPVILAMPHTGTYIPANIKTKLNANGRKLTDTDWHVNRLYRGLLPSATVIRANFHRYVIDANRDPSGKSLYPGQNTTDLCPTTDFDGQNIYKKGRTPNAREIERRRIEYHMPYHQAIKTEIAHLLQKHNRVVLYDCHSIRSYVPYLFDGILPDFNIGTNNGKSCSAHFENTAKNVCAQSPGYTSVCNGRFKGGWTTRHYSKPLKGVHAIQMELAQSTYMAEVSPWQYLPSTARKTRRVIRRLLKSLEHAALN